MPSANVSVRSSYEVEKYLSGSSRMVSKPGVVCSAVCAAVPATHPFSHSLLCETSCAVSEPRGSSNKEPQQLLKKRRVKREKRPFL